MTRLFLRSGAGGCFTLIVLYLIGLRLSFWGCNYTLDYIHSQREGVTSSAPMVGKVICTPFILPGILSGGVTSVFDTERDVQTPNQVN